MTVQSENIQENNMSDQHDSLLQRANDGDAEAQCQLGMNYHYHQGNDIAQDFALAAEWYRKAAEQGDTWAQFYLGELYSEGKGVSQDFSIAEEWYRKAAEQENAFAQWALGQLYLEGKGVPQDFSIAEEWYLKAAKKGEKEGKIQNLLYQCDLRFQWLMGLRYECGEDVPQDFALAAEWYRKAAEQGYSPAQNNLGELYSEGKGVTQDFAIAAEWFQKAAEQGNKDSLVQLALYSFAGKGTIVNASKGVSLLQKGVDQGFDWAQFFLGLSYITGEGVQQNWLTATELLQKSAAQGNTAAKSLLGCCYAYGPIQIQDWSTAIELFQNAAEQGNVLAQEQLSLCYACGNGVGQDLSQAAEWQAAAEKGVASEQGLAGAIFLKAPDATRNLHKAIRCFERATEQGDISAYFYLGLSYLQYDFTNDGSKSIECFQKAAEQGNLQAQLFLGMIYLFGINNWAKKISHLWAVQGGNAQWNLSSFSIQESPVNQDFAQAFYWMNKATLQGSKEVLSGLSFFYASGTVVEQNWHTAVQLWEQATNYNDALRGLFTVLGHCYLMGYGTEQNTETATAYYQRSADKDYLEGMAYLAFVLDMQDPNCTASETWLGHAAQSNLFKRKERKIGIEPDFQAIETMLVAFLRRKAETFMPAKVVLARLIKDEDLPSQPETNPITLLDEACLGNDITAFYYRGELHQEAQELEPALHCFRQVLELSEVKQSSWERSLLERIGVANAATNSNQIYAADAKNRLAMFAQEKINAIREQQHQAELIKAEQEKRAALEDLMSMFAHKFRGPLDSIVYNLGHQSDIRLYQQAAFTMRGLLDIFSLISTDAEKLKTRLKKDTQGEGNLQQVFTHALMNLMQQLLTTEGREKIRQHYWAYAVRNQLVPKETTRLNWLEDYEHIEAQLKNQWEAEWDELLKSTPNLEQLQHWIGEHLAPITVAGFAQESIRFQLYGATHSFLTIVLNELLLNAFKYYDSPERHPVQIEWSAESGFWLLRLINPSTRTEWRNTKGSGKGHQFLGLLAKRIEGRFDQPKLQNSYTAEFFFPYWSFATAE